MRVGERPTPTRMVPIFLGTETLMTHSDHDVKTWFAEWRLWALVSALLAGAWLAWSLFRGRFDTFWPFVVIVVWALVLLSAPLWPSKRARRSPAHEHPEDRRDE